MRILLLNTNPVVSRLITLCLKDRHAELYEFSSLETVEDNAYDLAFIDDASYGHIASDMLQRLHIAKLVLLTAHPEKRSDFIDTVIKKPFLPSKIIEVIESLSFREPSEPSPHEPPHIFPLSAAEETLEDLHEDKEEAASATPILNINEIERIKSLLEMEEGVTDEELWEKDEEALETLKREVIKQNLIDEGLEIVEEEDVVNALEKDVTLHITHDVRKSEEQREAFETKLLDAIEKMKIKKLKKLLSGTEVTINIKFKDSEE
ncbi:hypothetical protein [Sulfurovum sp.]|uniref:hypothetical protein n=1 Tax=Sulfurovum sp. TaxID=1969726 RepID=UPI002A36FF8F|nr:hypothetical protein [Sulfurovum sp.]MDD2451708.1 hypothetical protein [Sulfurovum sp.]MDD3500239.1 hypothetical protein [Sulfurovum sp.]MDY0403933.1 hypothetical protein [Sulfurovum sp.]